MRNYDNSHLRNRSHLKARVNQSPATYLSQLDIGQDVPWEHDYCACHDVVRRKSGAPGRSCKSIAYSIRFSIPRPKLQASPLLRAEEITIARPYSDTDDDADFISAIVELTS